MWWQIVITQFPPLEYIITYDRRTSKSENKIIKIPCFFLLVFFPHINNKNYELHKRLLKTTKNKKNFLKSFFPPKIRLRKILYLLRYLIQMVLFILVTWQPTLICLNTEQFFKLNNQTAVNISGF